MPVRAGIWRVEIGGRTLCAKVAAGVADEADGLAELGAIPGAPSVPDVVLVDPDLLVTGWVTKDRRTRTHEERLGRGLAALHRAPWPDWGGGSGWIGACRVDNPRVADGAAWYSLRLNELARRCGLAGLVGRVARRLDQLLPARRTRPRPRRPVVGQRPVGAGRRAVADRPVRARGPSGGGSGHAGPLRTGSRSSRRCLRGRSLRSPTAGRSGSGCFSCTRCSSTPCSSAAATGPRRRPPPAATSDRGGSAGRRGPAVTLGGCADWPTR